MRPNGNPPPVGAEPAPIGSGRVTSMAGWLAKRRQPRTDAPRLSVVIPVYNAEDIIGECLEHVFASTWRDFEVVLVDDGCTDGTRAIAARFPVRVVPTSGRVGPAAARNLGARLAEGDVLFFIDSDVMVRPDSLALLMTRFDAGDDVDAVVGVQAAEMRHRDLVSQYKNLWMRWTYCRLDGDVPLFYTTAAAIRRDAFLRAGGFDHGYATPNVEDTAFGQKLQRLGMRVRVQSELEVEHVKHYSLRGLLRTDFMRAVSLTRLKLRHRDEFASNNTSVPAGYIASGPVVLLTTLTALAAVGFRSPGAMGLAVAGAAAVAVLNREFLAEIARAEGTARTLGAFPILWIELLVAGIGAGVGLMSYPFGRRY